MKGVNVLSITGIVFLVALALLSGCSQPLEPADDEADTTPTEDDPASSPDEPSDDPPVRQEVFIDFDGQTVGYVADGFAGAGTALDPSPGFLDAAGWEIIGFSDGDLAYGDEADGGDYARGASPGGVATGGLYAFIVGEENHALGVQPTGTDFAPGSIGVRIPVTVEKPAHAAINYALWEHNDEDRSTRWTCEISADGQTFTAIDELTLITGEGADRDGWTRHDQQALVDLDDVDVDVTQTLHVRWTASDESGTGSRDEAAIDDILIAVESD
ncbi:MAG: hypothetical protein ACOC2D_15200 [Spirochaetota bacterium]